MAFASFAKQRNHWNFVGCAPFTAKMCGTPFVETADSIHIFAMLRGRSINFGRTIFISARFVGTTRRGRRFTMLLLSLQLKLNCEDSFFSFRHSLTPIHSFFHPTLFLQSLWLGTSHTFSWSELRRSAFHMERHFLPSWGLCIFLPLITYFQHLCSKTKMFIVLEYLFTKRERDKNTLTFDYISFRISKNKSKFSSGVRW